jgi:hypothetical protein
MPPARTLVTLLAALSLGGGVLPATALAQDDGGAGDQQYQDPFGSSQGSSNSSTQSGRASKRKKNKLSQKPNLGSSGSAGTSTGSGSAAPTSPPSSSELPRTGGDPGRLALIGLALLLCGIGLRLRMADERG